MRGQEEGHGRKTSWALISKNGSDQLINRFTRLFRDVEY